MRRLRQSGRVDAVERGVADIAVEVDAACISHRIPVEEAAGGGIVVALSQQLQTGLEIGGAAPLPAKSAIGIGAGIAALAGSLGIVHRSAQNRAGAV